MEGVLGHDSNKSTGRTDLWSLPNKRESAKPLKHTALSDSSRNSRHALPRTGTQSLRRRRRTGAFLLRLQVVNPRGGGGSVVTQNLQSSLNPCQPNCEVAGTVPAGARSIDHDCQCPCRSTC